MNNYSYKPQLPGTVCVMQSEWERLKALDKPRGPSDDWKMGFLIGTLESVSAQLIYPMSNDQRRVLHLSVEAALKTVVNGSATGKPSGA